MVKPPLMKNFYYIIPVAILFFRVPPHFALLAGTVLGLMLDPPDFIIKHGKKISTYLLQISVVLLGASLNVHTVLKEGIHGIGVTFVSLVLVLSAGHVLAKLFRVPSPLSVLISVGTAICGGSAISAVAPVLRAPGTYIGAAMAVVFLLNGVAVFVFPPVGKFLALSQTQFGTWAALAIHDTSSVVAASQLYGDEALAYATTLKLARALWIIPVTIFLSYRNGEKKKILPPAFILGFLFLSAMFTIIPDMGFLIPYFRDTSKLGLSLTLFLIGAGLRKKEIRELGPGPLWFGVTLWVLTLSASLLFVITFEVS